MRKRKPRIYDDEIYTDFGEQPSPLELQIGYALMPLVDEHNDSPLLNEIRYLHNEIEMQNMDCRCLLFVFGIIYVLNHVNIESCFMELMSEVLMT